MIPLVSDTLMIGRNKSCEIHVDCSKVSRHHAKLYEAGGTWVIEDLASANGIMVNGKRIHQHSLKQGDQIDIGSASLWFDNDANHDYSRSEQTLFIDRVLAKELFEGPEKKTANLTSNKKPANPQASPAWSPAVLIKLLWQTLTAIFPILEWASNYKKADLPGDLIAGITVTVMLIPQGMAYAMLAGLPPITGLYASLIPLLVYVLMGTSRQLAVGPVALDSLLIAAGVGVIAELGSDRFIELVIILAAMVGAIQFLMGLTRLGFLVNFLSHPVVTGFTTAAALIIAFSQLKHLLGFQIPQTHHIHTMLLTAYQHIHETNFYTCLIGLSSIATILLIKRIHRKLPGAIITVVVATFVVWWFQLDTKGVQIIGLVPQGLPTPSLPNVTFDAIQTLLPLAVTIALVGFMEAISIGKVFAAKNQYRVRANQELLAIGTANMVVSLFKGFPVTGGFSRTAVNAQAGAKTAFASLITAALLAVTLLYLTPLFYYLPNAVLAAVIITAVTGLIDVKEIHYLFKVKKSEGGLLIFTVLVTLVFGITLGLLLGVAASILLFIALNTRPNTAILGRLPNTDIFRNIERFPEAEQVPNVVILRIDASFYFANTEFLKDKLHEITESSGSSLRAVILDASSINDLDSSADTVLNEVVLDFKRRDITLYIAGVKGPVRDVMTRSGLYSALGAEHFFYTIDAAIKRLESNGISE